MKNNCRSVLGRVAAACLVTATMAASHLGAQVLDNGVDPGNLGKGDWIYILSSATNKLGGNVPSVTDVTSLMNYEKSQGMDFVIVKAGDGANTFPSSGAQFTPSLVNAAHAAGLKIFGYNRSYGTNVSGEISLATSVNNMGADGFVIDAEVEWESANLANNAALATQLCQGIKAAFPTRFLAHSPLPIISFHSSFPYKEFGMYCDAVMPQDYWKSIGYAPDQMVSVMDTEWRNWQSGLTGTYTNAIKPIAPVGQGWSPSSTETVTSSEIITFMNALTNDATPVTRGGYRGVSWWRADLHTADQWTGIKGTDIGGSQTNAPNVSNIAVTGITDTAATITWTTDISSDSAVEYGTTSSYGSLATDDTVTFNHSVSLSGLTPSTVYHYHVQSSSSSLSRSTSADLTFTTANPGGVADIIIDNASATVVGTWSTGTSATDKFATDYRFKSAGTGAAYLQYTPNIATAGSYQVYEWHSAGSNRSTNAPYVITFDGGSQTVGINERVNGGTWNYVGTYNFAAGTSGNIKITDTIPDSGMISLADAVKLVFLAPPPPPAAPSGLVANAVSASQINLSWSDNSTNEDNFIVSRSFSSGGPYTDIATLGSNVSSYSDTGCAANTTYFYVVRAKNNNGASANSNEAIATTPQIPPVAPSGLAASAISASQINLTWADNSTNENNFVVARSASSGGPYTDVAALGANVTSYNDTGLAGGTTYYYVVRASNTAGSSANSAQASATTLAALPAAPSGLVAQAISPTQINLSWTDNANNELNYIVSRSSTSGGPYTDIATLGANVVSYSDTGCVPNSTYYYVVRASNSAGASAASNQATGSTPQVAPTAPSGLVATAASSSQINLSWTDTSTNEANFIVGRSTSSGGPYTDIAVLGSNVTAYINTGLSAGTTYYYVVRASNSAGSSVNSAQASATTSPGAPAAPSGVFVAAVSASQIYIGWTDNSANEASFIVSRSTTAGGPYTDIVTTSANSTNFTDSGLSANTTYYYVVRARNSGGDSAYSAEDSITTYVTDLLIDNVSADVIGTWTTGTASTDKYGSNYQFKGQGTGTGYLQYTPKITTAGVYAVYEWHPVGSNRTTNAPHVITYNGGSKTVYVNQQVNGGKWNLLGNYSFAAGSSGNVQITDAFPDAGQMVIVDAIQFVLIPVPAAPSGLTATAASKSQINLKWTDNATNETSMVVARSTTSGGPYTDIATLAAGTTSYSDTGLSVGKTYYYVVRAVGTGGTSANSAQASAALVADIIIDNPAAAVTGTWTTGTSSTDKYGTDYRFKSAGTGTAFLKYTPSIVIAGRYQVYEWHSIGSNRTTAAPHVVTYNGGSTTVKVNQQVNGGQWNSIGTFSFAAGTAGSVKITDNFTDTTKVVIADGIKLVYVGP
jgi:Purple acid Phosphatase, N-terminal domain